MGWTGWAGAVVACIGAVVTFSERLTLGTTG